jgi:hypothetical protein
MRAYIIRLLLVSTVIVCSINSYGQSTYSNSIPKIPEPLYLINSTIIANGIIRNLNKEHIKNIAIYRGHDEPNTLKDLSSTGIIDMTYDAQVESESFTELGLRLKLLSPIIFVINGHKLTSTQVNNLRISPKAIGKLKITLATLGTPETAVCIQLAEFGRNPQGSQVDNPSGVMIR